MISSAGERLRPHTLSAPTNTRVDSSTCARPFSTWSSVPSYTWIHKMELGSDGV